MVGKNRILILELVVHTLVMTRLSEVECGKLGRQRTKHGCLMNDETAMMRFLSKDTMIALLQDCEHERTLLSFNMTAVANYNCLAEHLQPRYNS
jgi:hypothetical protein